MGEWLYSSTILDLGTLAEKLPGTQWIGDWLGIRAGMDAVE
jgi:hypothetical protein